MAALANAIQQPHHTKWAIQMALKTFVGAGKVWMVVESDDDVEVYERFVVPEIVVIHPSTDERGRRSYANVESIVASIKVENPGTNILGIRDADYIAFETPVHVVPNDIFVTDERDIEMMMLKAPSVQTSLREWAENYDDAMERCKDVCLFWGYLRIFNHVQNLNCKFHELFRVASVWDDRCHDFIETWRNNCLDVFFSAIGDAYDEEDFSTFVKDRCLDRESFYKICRGHDLLKLLSVALIHTDVYNPKTIMFRMTHSYSLADFRQTRLYADIKVWQERKCVKVMLD